MDAVKHCPILQLALNGRHFSPAHTLISSTSSWFFSPIYRSSSSSICSSNMIPRPRSIFSVGEESEWETRTTATTTTSCCCCSRSSAAPAGARCQTRGMGSSSTELQVGLKLLIHCDSPSTSARYKWSPAASIAVVTKSTLRPIRSLARPSCRDRLPSLSFLKTCGRCNKELSPQKDVYIYKGDQAFCSVECRYKQILRDERIEMEESFSRDQRRAAESRRLRAAAAESHGGVRRARAGGWRRVPAVAAA